MIFLFWLLVAIVVYAIIGYPLLVLLLARLVREDPVAPLNTPIRIDFVIAAYNEARVIAQKLRNTLEQIDGTIHSARIIVVSDGSTDETVSEALSVSDDRIEIVEIEDRRGKVNALNIAIERLNGDVVVFSDANGMLIPGALEALLAHYSDASVGGVCGAVRVEKTKGEAIAESEDLYWRYDQAVKLSESRLSSAVSAQGSFHSLRREFVRLLPPDAADDFTLSVRVISAGKRLVFEPGAVAREHVTENAKGEFMRRVRSTERGWRALQNFRSLLNPFKTGFYSFQLLSHKFLRRLIPFILFALLPVNGFLADQSWFFGLMLSLQVAFYGIALAAVVIPQIRRLPVVRHVFFAFMALMAMALGIINYYRGKHSTIWSPMRS